MIKGVIVPHIDAQGFAAPQNSQSLWRDGGDDRRLIVENAIKLVIGPEPYRVADGEGPITIGDGESHFALGGDDARSFELLAREPVQIRHICPGVGEKKLRGFRVLHPRPIPGLDHGDASLRATIQSMDAVMVAIGFKRLGAPALS